MPNLFKNIRQKVRSLTLPLQPIARAPIPISSRYLQPSLNAIQPHLPEAALFNLRQLLSQASILIRISKPRRTKTGDHRISSCRTHSLISVDATGNQYEFLITLLHEVAHALVTQRALRKTAPHGREWKSTFRTLLHDRLFLFPVDLRKAVETYANKPLYSTYADSALALALRQYDTTDMRLTVEELAPGQIFRLRNGLILLKGELLRKRYKCTTPDGHAYYVPPSLRITGTNL